MKYKQEYRGATLEAIVYPILVVAIMWSVFLVDRFAGFDLYKYGLKPGTIEGVKGIFLMPFIHGQLDFSHIINNSIPTLILMSTLIYFYRKIAVYVILFVWVGGGLLLWLLAANTGSYHIGMSGVIYGLFGFLFISGFFRRYLPLQAISLFVVFVYGSMIWGIFPVESGVSWEGHLFGFSVGLLVGFAFRKEGPVPPKYRYEIERELGIEPPDLEAIWWENQQRIMEEYKRREEERKNALQEDSNSPKIIYHLKPKNPPEEKSDQKGGHSQY